MIPKINKISPRRNSPVNSSNENSPRDKGNKGRLLKRISPREFCPKEEDQLIMGTVYSSTRSYLLNTLSMKLQNSTLPNELQNSIQNILDFIILNYDNEQTEKYLLEFFNDNYLDNLIIYCEKSYTKYKIIIDDNIKNNRHSIKLKFVGLSDEENTSCSIDTWVENNPCKNALTDYFILYLSANNYKMNNISIKNNGFNINYTVHFVKK